MNWSCFPDQNNLANNIPDNKKLVLKIYSAILQITATDKKKYAESKLSFKISNPISKFLNQLNDWRSNCFN